MPRLGEAVEPAHAGNVTPWWRGVDGAERDPAPAAPEADPVQSATPAAGPGPKAMPWPLD